MVYNKLIEDTSEAREFTIWWVPDIQASGLKVLGNGLNDYMVLALAIWVPEISAASTILLILSVWPTATFTSALICS